jgi:hypothetical protein
MQVTGRQESDIALQEAIVWTLEDRIRDKEAKTE